MNHQSTDGKHSTAPTDQMTRYVHEAKPFRTRQLHLRSFEETVMLLANEESVVNGFLGHVSNVCVEADDTDIIWVRIELI